MSGRAAFQLRFADRMLCLDFVQSHGTSGCNPIVWFTWQSLVGRSVPAQGRRKAAGGGAVRWQAVARRHY
jgi:hypothetical protein